MHKGIVIDRVKGYEVLDCRTCGYKHLHPIPSNADLEAVYRNEYYSREKPLYLERAQEDLPWWNLVYRDRYRFFEKHLAKDRRRILDVGSGPGFFLDFGKKRGWCPLGIEPSQIAAEFSRSLELEVINDFLDPSTAKNLGRFDAVNMSEVLEHVPNPDKMLELAFELLDPGGILCVVVPNDYNPIQLLARKAFGFTPWWIAPPHHINFFRSTSSCCSDSTTSVTTVWAGNAIHGGKSLKCAWKKRIAVR